jgi:hypothetical protein
MNNVFEVVDSEGNTEIVFASRELAEEYIDKVGRRCAVEERPVYDTRLEYAEVLTLYVTLSSWLTPDNRVFDPVEYRNVRCSFDYPDWPPPECKVFRSASHLTVTGTDHERVRETWAKEIVSFREEWERRCQII